MNNNVKIVGMLLGATLFFNVAMNYMGDNITEFENRPLPPKKVKIIRTNNPILKVDATSRDDWTLVDFSEKKTHKVKDIDSHPEELGKHDWDMGFQRTKVITNGGATHKGGVGVADLGAVSMDSVNKVSTPSFVEDTRDWGTLRNDAISGWYNYRTRTHNVESNKSVYLVRTAEGGHVKMRILNYYCNHEESECKTGICTREEAACLTVEYVYIPPGESVFPETPKARTAALNSDNQENLN